jgi:hypothetical protein
MGLPKITNQFLSEGEQGACPAAGRVGFADAR